MRKDDGITVADVALSPQSDRFVEILKWVVAGSDPANSPLRPYYRKPEQLEFPFMKTSSR